MFDNIYFSHEEMMEDCDRAREEIVEDLEEMTLSRLADEVISHLKSVGISILRYDAYSTNSIYLKLDYGMCNTIRISDHSGKKHLRYRYNLIYGLDESYMKVDKYPRYYYTLNDMMLMIDKIITDRDSKVMKYGARNYNTYMEKNKQDHRDDKNGFWSQARLV